MRWNISEYNNVKDIRVPPNNLWKPDILMYNRYRYISISYYGSDIGWAGWCLVDVNTRLTVCCVVPVKLSTRPTRPTWWWPVTGPAPTSPQVSSSQLHPDGLNLSSSQGSLCLPVPWTLLGSPLMIKIARWNLAAGLTMDLRSIKCRA